MAGLGGRLLDSARADPSAVSFQVRPVDVVLSSGPRSIAEARQTSFTNFGSLEAIQQVRPGEPAPAAHSTRSSSQCLPQSLMQ